MRFAPTPVASPASASQPIFAGRARRSARDALLVVLVTLVASSCFVAIRNVADLSPPSRFATLRLALAAGILFPLLPLARQPLLPPRRYGSALAILALAAPRPRRRPMVAPRTDDRTNPARLDGRTRWDPPRHATAPHRPGRAPFRARRRARPGVVSGSRRWNHRRQASPSRRADPHAHRLAAAARSRPPRTRLRPPGGGRGVHIDRRDGRT